MEDVKFNLLYYFFLITCVFGLVLWSVYSLININIKYLVLSLGLLILLIVYIKEKKIYDILIIIFSLSPFGLIILIFLPLIQSFSSIGNNVFFVFVSAYLFIIGLISSYVFKLTTTSKQYLKAGILLSSFISLIFVFNKFTSLIITKFLKQSAVIKEKTSFLEIFSSQTLNFNLLFFLSFIFFNLAYLFFYFKYEDRNLKEILFYFIPILMYFSIFFILKEMVNFIIPIGN